MNIQKLETSDFKKLDFINPDSFYWPGYVWFWNDKLSEDEIFSQLRDMNSVGAKSVWIIPVPKDFRPNHMPTNMEPNYLFIIPILLGLMMLTRLIGGIGWISRWPMALIIGFSAGTNLTRYLQSDFLAQVHSSSVPFIVTTSAGMQWGESFSAIVLVLGVLAALIYFFFSVEHKGAIGGISRGGIWVLMVTFGAAFGYTVMARISLLIGRFEFLKTWVQSVIG